MSAIRRTDLGAFAESRVFFRAGTGWVSSAVQITTCLWLLSACAGNTPPENTREGVGGTSAATQVGGTSARTSARSNASGGRSSASGNTSNKGSTGGSTATREGTSNGGASPKTSWSDPDSTCNSKIDTGDRCFVHVDSDACELATRTCICGDDSAWSCTPKDGAGGTSGQGGTNSGGTKASTTGTATVGGSTSQSSTVDPNRPVYAPAALVENTASECEVPSLPAAAQLPKIAKLPDPFKKIDGELIKSKSEWSCRRQEIHKQAEKYIYGQKPPKPANVSGTVTKTKVTVNVEEQGKKISFSAEVVLPSTGSGPFPAIINLGARGGFGGITLGEKLVLDQGVGIIFYNHNELGVEGQAEASRGKPNTGLFYNIYTSSHDAGLLMAWAWGASRLIDVLQQSGGDIIDVERLGVTGCSRNGKGAFTVGVFDERIALTIPQETSTAGVPALRVVDSLNGAELTKYNYNGLNWLSDVFGPFVMNAAQLPIDTHELVGMIAPRGLLVLENQHMAQFAAPAGHVAALAGAEIYKALGFEKNVSYISDVANDQHCAAGKPEYTEPLVKNIAAFLKGDGTAPGIIKAGSKAVGNLSQWRDWQTPTLGD